MHIRQYVYFGIASQTMTPGEIENHVGLVPDETRTKGFVHHRNPSPARYHRWMIVCREPGLRVDKQLEHVLDRIEGIADRIAQVVDLVRTEGGASGAGFQVVRYFEDPNGEEEVIRRVGNLESLTGQHQLLGWHLDKRLMDFLIRTGTELDADEYG